MIAKSIVAAGLVAAMTAAASAADATRPVLPPTAPVTQALGLAGDLSIALGLYGYPNDSIGLFDARARVNKPLGADWNLEVQAASQAIFEGGSSQPLGTTAYGYLWRASTNHAWALFGGASFGPPVIIGTVGLQAKHFTQNASFGVFAAYNWFLGESLGAFGASANFYFNPDHRIGVLGQVITTFQGESSWSIAADFEHRFQHPVGLWVSGTYIGYGNSANLWKALIGVRFYLDDPTDTLQSHERKVPWFHDASGLVFLGSG